MRTAARGRGFIGARHVFEVDLGIELAEEDLDLPAHGLGLADVLCAQVPRGHVGEVEWIFFCFFVALGYPTKKHGGVDRVAVNTERCKALLRPYAAGETDAYRD